MKKTHFITVIPGDGVGPEVIRSTQQIINATGLNIHWEEAEAGAQVFRKGVPSGVPKETLDSIKKNKIVLKGPLETPVGYGEKSANVTLRKLFETFANVRPITEFKGVNTPYSGRNLDLVIVRENVEDLYAGIEHMQTADVAQCLKLITRPGTERIIRYAFEYAKSRNRKKIHCATKANIMKFTEGLFKKIFEEVSLDYPDIEAHHIIVDNCAHQLVKKPEQFDVIVTTNMNGDILSDLTSALVGGLGFAPGANVGGETSIFEAVHGSAPKYAGKNVINPTAAILSGVMMLEHLGELEAADKIMKAVKLTWQNPGTQTRDVIGDLKGITTSEFTQKVIENLNNVHADKKTISPINISNVLSSNSIKKPNLAKLVGVDVFIEYEGTPSDLGTSLENIGNNSAMKLKMISNRGTKVFPGPNNANCVNHWRCRYISQSGDHLGDRQIYDLLFKLSENGFKWVHIEKLQYFNESPGFSKAQGED